MAIGINDIDQIDFDNPDEGVQEKSITEQNFGDEMNYEKPYFNAFENNQEPPKQETQEPGSKTDENKEDVITRLLHSKGIEDTTKIKFESEDGTLEDRDWNSLSEDEQFNILSTKEETSKQNNNLSDEELALIQDIRKNKMTPEEYVETWRQQGAQQYIEQQFSQEPSYEVDDFTDDDLFMADLQARIPDITDEELESALAQAKSNEDFYKKQVAGIREEYKKLETQRNQEKEAYEQQQQQDNFNQFANTIADSINSLSDVGGLEIDLDDDDKSELADFILGTDKAGVSNLGKALNNPDILTRMAWFALKGQDTIDGIVDYFKEQIKQVRENSYRKGMEDGKKGLKTPPRVVVTDPGKTQQNSDRVPGNITSIDDLD